MRSFSTLAILASASTVVVGQYTNDTLTCRTWLLGDEFGVVQPLHGHMDIIWNDHWRPLAEIQEVPFYEANVTDFEPIMEYLIQHNLSDAYQPEFTEAFFAPAAELTRQAEVAERNNDTDLARDLYIRAAVVYRIARYPNPITPLMQEAWHKQVDVYFRGAKYLEPPVHQTIIPHVHAANGDGDSIPVAVRHALNVAEGAVRPVLLFVTGLDQFRPDFDPLTSFATAQGWDAVAVEIPGTGDSPGNRSDPLAGDRQWDSVLDWVDSQPEYDSTRVGVWGFSTGSYYATRMAHTHKDRLRAVVSQGGASHLAFDAAWINQMDGNTQPFRSTPSLMYKWGYDTLEDFAARSQADYSLVLDGTLDKNCTTLLMLNGLHDSFFPAEDTLIPLDFGWPKSAKLFADQEHMGGSGAFQLAQAWLTTVL